MSAYRLYSDVKLNMPGLLRKPDDASPGKNCPNQTGDQAMVRNWEETHARLMQRYRSLRKELDDLDRELTRLRSRMEMRSRDRTDLSTLMEHR